MNDAVHFAAQLPMFLREKIKHCFPKDTQTLWADWA